MNHCSTKESTSGRNLAELVANGWAAARKDEWDTAFEHFEQALSIDSKSRAVLIGAAVSRGGMGDEAAARALLDELLTESLDDVEALSARAVVACRQGDFEQALSDARYALEIAPDALHVRRIAVWVSIELGDLDGGEDFAQDLSSESPEDAFLAGLLAHARQGSNEEKSAYERSIALGLESAAAWYNLGILLAELGDTSESVEAFERALELEPDGWDIRLNLGVVLGGEKQYERSIEFLRACCKECPESALAHYSLGVVLGHAELVEDARASYESCLSVDDSFVSASMELAYLAFRASDFEECIEHYRRAIEIAPELRKAHYNMARALQHLGKWEEARASYEQCVIVRPDYSKAFVKIALTSLELRDFERARSACDRAFALGATGSNEYWYVKARLAEREGKIDRALELYEHIGMDEGSSYKDALLRQSALQRRQGHVDKAKALAKRALEEKVSARAYYELGRSYQKAREMAKARVAYKKALGLSAYHTNSAEALARCYFDDGELDKCRSICRRVLKRRRSHRLLYRYARTLERLGKYDAAIRAAKRSLKRRPDFKRNLRLIARCYARLGDKERAKKYKVRAAKA